ncbi:hypothetical protein JCM1841_000485 [Sporobolomyces salmonicolor]
MPRLAAQPEAIKPIPLRSGFYALPFSSGQHHLFARVHSGAAAEDGDVPAPSNQLFVTGLPLGMTEKALKSTLGKVWEGTKVKAVEMLPATADGVLSLYQRELMAAKHASVVQGISISPLFDPDSPSTSAIVAPPPSAIVTFSSSPAFPPPSYSSTTPLSLPAAPSFLASSASGHALARPHRSIVIAHVDSWMNAYDARKLAAAPPAYSVEALLASREAEKKAAGKKGKGKKGKQAAADVGPVPGSAAEALARHAAQVALAKDRSHDPDEAQDGEWTLVTGGGKHGKSLLPTGTVPTLQGYGGISVKVAGKKRGRAADEDQNLDAGIKKIVGQGFYRFNKAEGRRQDLAALKSKFEDDKARVDRLRSNQGGKGRGAGSGGREQRSYRPY